MFQWKRGMQDYINSLSQGEPIQENVTIMGLFFSFPFHFFNNSNCVCGEMVKVTWRHLLKMLFTLFISVDWKLFDLLVISLELRLHLISQTMEPG